jgi:hypothetical protein
MASPTETVQVTSNIPEWAKPYAERLLGEAEKLSRRGFQPYQGQMVEEFNPLQEQAFLDIAGMRPASQLGQATGLAGLAGLRAERTGQYTPMGAQQFYDAPQMREMGLSYISAQAPNLQQYQMGPAERVRTQSFARPGASEQFMSPYMQGVVEEQKKQAIQDYSRQLPGMSAAAARAGARGGTRETLLQSEAQRGLQNQLGGIQAAGLQNAFQQAQQQFNAEQAARLQAQLANQAAGINVGSQNLGALLGVQQLGAGQNLQSQLANQQAQLQTQQQGLGQLQNLNQAALQNAAQRAQYGLAGAQLGEQSRQFGAGLGLSALQQQLAAAGTLGQLGQQQYGQQMGINQAQLGAGSQIQALGQQDLASRYQQFLNEQQLPFQQMGFFSDILRGTPSSAAIQQRYQAPPSLGGIVGGLGLAGLGGLLGGFGGS